MGKGHEALEFFDKFYQNKCVHCELKKEKLVYMTEDDWLYMVRKMREILLND